MTSPNLASLLATDNSTTMQSAAAATGNGTACPLEGYSGALLQVTGTFSATLTFEATLDGTTYVSVEAMSLTDGTKATTATATGLYLVACPGAKDIRARVSTYVSGSVTVTGRGVAFVSAQTADITSDVEIGAVEIKDATGTTRAVVKTTGAASTDGGIVTRPLMPTDGTNTQPAMDAAARAGFQKITDGTNTAALTTAGADGVSNTQTDLAAEGREYHFNGTSWDRTRGNLDNITAVASASYTTTQTQADQTNYNARGIIAVLDMTNVGTGSVTLEIDAKDPVSGKYYALLTGAAVTTNSTNTYTVYPGNTVTANVSASTALPRTWRIKVTANNANAATYSVGCSLIL